MDTNSNVYGVSPQLSSNSWTQAGCPTTQLNSDTTWRYSQIQRLKAQSYKTAPSSVNFRSQSQVQSFTGDSDQPTLYQNFPQTPPRVWLISWSSSQNSRENFYLLHHWLITKDTTQEQPPGRGAQGRVWEGRHFEGCHYPQTDFWLFQNTN